MQPTVDGCQSIEFFTGNYYIEVLTLFSFLCNCQQCLRIYGVSQKYCDNLLIFKWIKMEKLNLDKEIKVNL